MPWSQTHTLEATHTQTIGPREAHMNAARSRHRAASCRHEGRRTIAALTRVGRRDRRCDSHPDCFRRRHDVARVPVTRR
jgi:hypothetical protein